MWSNGLFLYQLIVYVHLALRPKVTVITRSLEVRCILEPNYEAERLSLLHKAQNNHKILKHKRSKRTPNSIQTGVLIRIYTYTKINFLFLIKQCT